MVVAARNEPGEHENFRLRTNTHCMPLQTVAHSSQQTRWTNEVKDERQSCKSSAYIARADRRHATRAPQSLVRRLESNPCISPSAQASYLAIQMQTAPSASGCSFLFFLKLSAAKACSRAAIHHQNERASGFCSHRRLSGTLRSIPPV